MANRNSDQLSIIKILIAILSFSHDAGLPLAVAHNHKCNLKGIFNFGDSKTDTGAFFAAFPPQLPPYGMTYFNKTTGRSSDGRVLLDFLAQAIGIPYVSPYLKSIGADFKYGANFATAGSMVIRLNASMIMKTGANPFNLGVQLDQMKHFQSTVFELQSSSTKIPTHLPSADIFGKALYTMHIGSNDILGSLIHRGMKRAKEITPQIISGIASAVKGLILFDMEVMKFQELYGIGGRTIWVLNLAPIGCYPYTLVKFGHESSDLDQYGCIISANKFARDYNSMLKEAITRTRAALPGDASIIYVDTHSALLDLFHHPTSYGMEYGTRACCGEGGEPYNYNPDVPCGNTKVVNGSTLRATACEDPSKYVSWDGTHTTEAANKFVTLAILNGSLFDPPFPLQRLCDLHPIID